ncbi:preprotein translocase subunit SecE [candidate division KSB3 bacterium]|uniref:Protein translocase subunit SecE n=1 Tax=candidate division KSB3 bacterium TaxID=2044937 RepID=A0A9D5JZA5_9BACT|nr:preprotein translocase subunit SecE [candidate division KSB3 bacterium]MBD3326978.1 preprotein translocase subunit SecE [candidate division KSB3 bacterium]
MRKFIQFLKEARVELKKVSWPTRKELVGSTTLVIVVSVIAGVFLGLLDIVFFRSIYGLIHLLGL